MSDDQVQQVVVDQGALVALNSAEINQQIATAKAYPRSVKEFRDQCLDMATLTEQIAQDCIYALPRAGKVIEGPSARLAEIVAHAWGNCRVGARIVNEEMNFVTAQGVFMDLEKNVAITYEVKRRITDKNGRRFKDDMIGVTGNAACSIALRNAVFKGVPKAFWSDIYDAARRTVMGDSKTLSTKRADALAFLQNFGATPEMIFGTLGVGGIEDVTLEHLVTLRGLATAIKDGDTTVEQAFSAPGTAGSTTVAGDKPVGLDGLGAALNNGNQTQTGSDKPAAEKPDGSAANPAATGPAATSVGVDVGRPGGDKTAITVLDKATGELHPVETIEDWFGVISQCSNTKDLAQLGVAATRSTLQKDDKEMVIDHYKSRFAEITGG